MINENKLQDLQTGDILLFDSSDHWYDWLVKKWTTSYYSHSAMVLRNPSFLPEDKREGLYIIQSDKPDKIDIEDNKHKFGVQIVPIDDIFDSGYDKVFVRRLTTTRDENFDNLLSEVHKKVHDIPYDLNFKIGGLQVCIILVFKIVYYMVKRHINVFFIQLWCVIFIESYN